MMDILFPKIASIIAISALCGACSEEREVETARPEGHQNQFQPEDLGNRQLKGEPDIVLGLEDQMGSEPDLSQETMEFKPGASDHYSEIDLETVLKNVGKQPEGEIEEEIRKFDKYFGRKVLTDLGFVPANKDQYEKWISALNGVSKNELTLEERSESFTEVQELVPEIYVTNKDITFSIDDLTRLLDRAPSDLFVLAPPGVKVDVSAEGQLKAGNNPHLVILAYDSEGKATFYQVGPKGPKGISVPVFSKN